MDSIRVVAIQMPHGQTLAENEATARRMLDEARTAGAHVALLPEYWFLPIDPATRTNGMSAEFEGGRDFLRAESERGDMLVAGNAPLNEAGHIFNTVFLFANGAEIGRQRKAHPMPLEREWGVAAAERFETVDWAGMRIGTLVCADVLHPEACRVLGLQGAELVLCPVLSPYKANDEMKGAREAMFVSRSYDNGYYLVKAGGFGKTRGGEIVGRSLVCGPQGVLARYADERAEKILVADLDLVWLRELRKKHLALDRRNPAAYGELTK